MGIYEYSVERPDGTMQPLPAYEGKVLLIDRMRIPPAVPGTGGVLPEVPWQGT